MKIAIVGSARFSSVDEIHQALINSKYLDKIDAVVSRGEDTPFDNAVERYCKAKGIRLIIHKADFEYWRTRTNGKTKNPAANIRDQEITKADSSSGRKIDAALVIWNGESKDVKYFIDCLEDANKHAHIVMINDSDQKKTSATSSPKNP